MNKILKYLKKNIFLVYLILALMCVWTFFPFIAYKLYKKEGLEDCKKCFGEKHAMIKDIDSSKPIILNLNKMSEAKVWIDLQSIKINGSKNLAIVDANQYDVVKKRLSTCEDINIQNINLKKNLDQYKNRGFFARLFNW